MKPRLAITLGDVNGIGPEITLKALAHPTMGEICSPVVVGSVQALESARAFAPNCPPLKAVQSMKDRFPTDAVPVLGSGAPPPQLNPGVVTAEAGCAAVEWIKEAVRLALRKEVDGIVTCPVNKKGIQLAGYPYLGHTEILQEMTGVDEVFMSLFSDKLRIVHVTAHRPLKDAIAALDTPRIVRAVRAGYDALVRLGLRQKRIAVAGVNPHAGEDSILGTEEDRIVKPAVEACRAEGLPCSGPYPPDTVFRRMFEGEFELVVALYHDQGHVPFKLVAMDEGTQVTLGIPIVRTSVDHGTAYDIAWKGVARENSLCAAVRFAALLARSQAQP